MKQDVMITLRGTQTCVNEEPQTVELMTRGTMTGRNGKYAISYVETELTGTEGVVSTFLVFNPQRVVLTREGPIKSRMVFVEGSKDESLYDLGFGSLLLTIATNKISVDLGDNGGRLFIDYTVDVEHTHTSQNSYEILVSPIPDNN